MAEVGFLVKINDLVGERGWDSNDSAYMELGMASYILVVGWLTVQRELVVQGDES